MNKLLYASDWYSWMKETHGCAFLIKACTLKNEQMQHNMTYIWSASRPS